ncbi:hypothetical protein HPB50_013886 [Hyalomma asiaticum]|uniref:Uncharacterized protein n=1 Tax=Hyalomma asiaticum TaxID=266040 RepID=A0ACB7SFC4_HYAAI|nr:hypothetical protein HPB50_013886 [Hyalomma asiaticum]
MQEKRETKIEVKFPVEVLPPVWAQLKSDVICNCFRKAGFCRANDAPSTAPQDPCVPSVWPQIQEAFGAEDFADFVSFDDGIVDSEQLTDDEIAALVKNSSDPLSEDDSSEETEAPVKLSSSQAMDYIEALKGYFLQQQGDCSAEVLQHTEMQHKVKETRRSLQDSRSGLQELTIGHHLDDRAHIVGRKRNRMTGEEDQSVEYVNLDEEEAEGFSREWQQRAQCMSRPHSMYAALPSRNLPALPSTR